MTDSCNLRKVQQVMARIQPNHVRHALLAPFRVNADAFEVGRRCTSEQAQIRSPKHRELFERHFN